MRDDEGRVFISGTGRAGTTFLIRLLTALDLDTGFNGNEKDGVYFAEARAGFEWNIHDPNAPRIVKSPFVCDHLDDLVRRGTRISHLVVPIRDFSQAAASRVLVQGCQPGLVAGGLWGTKRAHDQPDVLREKFCSLILAAVRHDIPITFLEFPRLVNDPDYLFGKLQFLLEGVAKVRFQTAFKSLSKPEWVHSFPAE